MEDILEVVVLFFFNTSSLWLMVVIEPGIMVVGHAGHLSKVMQGFQKLQKSSMDNLYLEQKPLHSSFKFILHKKLSWNREFMFMFQTWGREGILKSLILKCINQIYMWIKIQVECWST